MLTTLVYFLVAAYGLQTTYCLWSFFTPEGSPYVLVTGGILGSIAAILYYAPQSLWANVIGFFIGAGLLMSVVNVTETSYGVDRTIGKFNAVLIVATLIVFAIRVFS